MLTDKEIIAIRNKIKTEYINQSILAKKVNVSRQMIYLVLNKKCSSARIEKKLIEWSNNRR